MKNLTPCFGTDPRSPGRGRKRRGAACFRIPFGAEVASSADVDVWSCEDCCSGPLKLGHLSLGVVEGILVLDPWFKTVARVSSLVTTISVNAAMEYNNKLLTEVGSEEEERVSGVALVDLRCGCFSGWSPGPIQARAC